MKNKHVTSKKRRRKQKDLNINDSTISTRAKMPKYEECQKLVNPQGLPLEVLSQSERIFLEFCERYDSYPEELKQVVKQW